MTATRPLQHGPVQVLDMLYLLNVSRKGELLPLVFSEQPDTMPIVCEVPPLLPAEPFLVAYSCMPQVLTPLRQVGCHPAGCCPGSGAGEQGGLGGRTRLQLVRLVELARV